jgi:hypothetical protein
MRTRPASAALDLRYVFELEHGPRRLDDPDADVPERSLREQALEDEVAHGLRLLGGSAGLSRRSTFAGRCTDIVSRGLA